MVHERMYVRGRELLLHGKIRRSNQLSAPAVVVPTATGDMVAVCQSYHVEKCE